MPATLTRLFFEAFTERADWQERIVGVAVVGSHARGNARPESDVDLVILALNADEFVDDVTWTSDF